MCPEALICVQLLDPACGALVIQSLDISIADGSIVVKPTHVKWTTGMIAAALGNNKIVRFLAASWHPDTDH